MFFFFKRVCEPLKLPGSQVPLHVHAEAPLDPAAASLICINCLTIFWAIFGVAKIKSAASAASPEGFGRRDQVGC